MGEFAFRVAHLSSTRSGTATAPKTVLLVIGGEPGAAFVASSWDEAWAEP
jgi:hypothetical protein